MGVLLCFIEPIVGVCELGRRAVTQGTAPETREHCMPTTDTTTDPLKQMFDTLDHADPGVKAAIKGAEK